MDPELLKREVPSHLLRPGSEGVIVSQQLVRPGSASSPLGAAGGGGGGGGGACSQGNPAAQSPLAPLPPWLPLAEPPAAQTRLEQLLADYHPLQPFVAAASFGGLRPGYA